MNFDPFATELDDSCVLYGCTFEEACNFNPEATVDDGTCETVTCAGCTDPLSCNFDPEATFDNGGHTSWTSVASVAAVASPMDSVTAMETWSILVYAEGLAPSVAPTPTHATSTAGLW